jgi:hypothetical protein
MTHWRWLVSPLVAASLIALCPVAPEAQQVVVRGAPAREVELLDLDAPVDVVSPLGVDAALCALRPALSSAAARQVAIAREDVCADDSPDVHASLWVPVATPLSTALQSALSARAELHRGVPPFNAPIATWLHAHDVPPVVVPGPLGLSSVSAVHSEHGWQVDVEDAGPPRSFFGRGHMTQERFVRTNYALSDRTAGCVRTLLRTDGGGFVVLANARGGAAEAARCVEGPVSTLDPGNVEALVPKLELRTGRELGGPLQRLGVTDLFDGRTNPMPQLAPHTAFNAVIQSVALHLDEHGISVEASTIIAMTLSPPHVSRQIVYDHPFVMRVVDRSGATVALGWIGDLGT